MRFSIYSLFIGIVLSSFGQIDSLKRVINSTTDSATVFEVSDLLVKQLAFKQPDSALYFGFKVFEDVLRKDTSIAASISLNIGTAYYAKGNYEKALIYWQKAGDLSDLTVQKSIKPLALNNVAIIYQNTGRIEDAITNFEQAIEIYNERNDTIRVGRGTFNIGKAYIALGEDSIGINYLKKSIGIYQEVGHKALRNLANAYNELASVYYYDSEYPAALENYHQSIKRYLEAGDTLGSLKPKGNIGNIHRNLGNVDEALSTYREIIVIKEKYRQFSVHYNYHNLGEALADNGHYNAALTNYRVALTLRENAGLRGLLVSTLIGVADCFKEMKILDSAGYYYSHAYENSSDLDEAEFRASGICAYGGWLMHQGRKEEAFSICLECYEEAKEINARNLLVNAATWLQDIYEDNDAYKEAYFYQTQANQLGDSLFNADLIRKITNQEASFKYEKELIRRENEIQLLESKEQVANLQITLLVIGVILIVIIAFFVSRMMILKRERRKRELEAIGQFRESMTGMIAHDLKTPLSVIMNSSKGDNNNRQMARQMLHLINNMLDVHRFESTEVNLSLEHCSIKVIIDEAKAHLGPLLGEKDLTLRVEMDENYLISVDKNVMVRVLVNLLTNAIKYSPFNETILLSVKSENTSVTVSVSDQGQGISEDQVEAIFKSFGQLDPKDSGGIGSTGLGLTFVKLALQAHGSDIRLDSSPGKGTTFSFVLPVVKSMPDVISEMEEYHFEFSHKVKAFLRQKLVALRKLDLYQIGDIEKELEDLKGQGDEADKWVEHILNSVYAGNKEKYDQLLNEVES